MNTLTVEQLEVLELSKLRRAMNKNLTQIVTATEAAAILGLTTRTIRQNCERGKYTCRKSGATWLIIKSTLRTS